MSTALRTLIVDDEPPARDRLRRLLESMDGVEILGEAANGIEAVAICDEMVPDVVLLDIRMPGMDGIETARHFNGLDKPPAVIFCTAFDQYAIDAFDAQAVGYLLKPVRRERLERALDHATRLTRPQLNAINESTNPGGSRAHVAARIGEKLSLIPIADVLYFRAEQKYTTVHHIGGEVLIDEPLKALEEEFARDFVRVHRNSLIAVRAIDALEKSDRGGYVAVLRGTGEAIDVSRRLVAEVRKRLKGTAA